MKICFVTVGNIEKIATMKRAIGMADCLTNLGWEVSIIAEDCKSNKDRIALECNDKTKFFFFKAGNRTQEVFQKTKFITEIKPHYIFFCSFSSRNRIIKSKLGYKPKIIVEHSELPSAIKDNRWVKKLYVLAFEYYSIIYADMLVCASRYLETYYRNRCKRLLKIKYDIFYSPYAFNKQVMDYPRVLTQSLKRKYKSKKVFIYLGTLTRNYGLFSMLEAAKKLKDTHSDFFLFLIGKGRHEEEARKYINDNKLQDYIIITGYVPEEHLSSYFDLASAFISPLNDTIQDIARCPSKIYMYLPFQKPILTSKIGESYIIFGEQYPYYFDTSDANSLYKQMIKLWDNPNYDVQLNVEHHSWDYRSLEFDNWIKSKKF